MQQRLIAQPFSMSTAASPMAGYQVTLYGRIWVTTKESRPHPLIKLSLLYV